MEKPEYALFETAIGHCAVAWSSYGIVGLQLPERTAADTLKRLRRRFPEMTEARPPRPVQEAIHGVTRLLQGERIDFSPAVLDFRDIDAWDRSVYASARTIQAGETLTYGEIAARLGDPAQAREVGQALGRNPWPIIVPCHRVTAANGKTGGFSAHGGVTTKLRLLAIESAHATSALPLFAAGSGVRGTGSG